MIKKHSEQKKSYKNTATGKIRQRKDFESNVTEEIITDEKCAIQKIDYIYIHAHIHTYT